MPTVARIGGHRFFFFSNEGNEPPHVHVESGDTYAKFWLEPVSLAQSVGYHASELTQLRKLVTEQRERFREQWDEYFSRKPLQAVARDVRIDGHMVHVFLQDGRQISVPLEWFPRLRNASEKQRKHWRLIGHGIGIHWPEVDEDISVTALLE